MEKLQNQLNKQAEQFQPKKTARTVYIQPQHKNGRIEYIQPRREGK